MLPGYALRSKNLEQKHLQRFLVGESEERLLSGPSTMNNKHQSMVRDVSQKLKPDIYYTCIYEHLKVVLHLLPQKSSKISVFCAQSQIYQHLFEK